MTQAGTARLYEFSSKLPSFENREEAEQAFFQYRDGLLERLLEAGKQAQEPLDYSPESLKALETWYFQLWEGDAFESLSMDRACFERCMAMYFGEVVVRNNSAFSWGASENPILRRRYAFGIGRPRYFMFLWRLKDLYARPDNKRRQSLWRAWRRHAPRETEQPEEEKDAGEAND